MEALQAMKAIVEASGLTHRQIARRLGKYDSYISQMFTRSVAPGADTLASVAKACNFKLELVPMDGGESIVIGDYPESKQSRPADQARSLILRAAALLERADE